MLGGGVLDMPGVVEVGRRSIWLPQWGSAALSAADAPLLLWLPESSCQPPCRVLEEVASGGGQVQLGSSTWLI